jgi:hypothetical protein
MANAKRCDRCNKFYNGPTKPTMIIGGDSYSIYIAVNGGREIDFCEDCIKKLEKFLNKGLDWRNKED